MLLEYKTKDGEPKRLRLTTAKEGVVVTIGRSGDASITVSDPKASRINTAIRYWDGIFVIRDVNSRNGTHVNGKSIDVARLRKGDLIKVGDTEIRVCEDATAKKKGAKTSDGRTVSTRDDETA